MRRGDHAIAVAMEIHLLLYVLVTALFSLDLYTRFSQIVLGLNVASSAYFFKGLSKRSEIFTGIAVFFIFSLGLLKFKVLAFGLEPRDIRRFLRYFRDGFRLNYKVCGSMAVLERPRTPVENGHVIANGDSQSILDPDGGESEELSLEDHLLDVMSLRELVKAERRRANLAMSELEKERAAAATAAEEAMSMILRLQREKSCLEIESNHYRRLAEQKQQYDQGLIEFLRNVVTEQDRERDLLEGELRFCRRRMNLCSQCQWDNGLEEEDDLSSPMAARHDDEQQEEDELPISSLEFDSWAL